MAKRERKRGKVGREREREEREREERERERERERKASGNQRCPSPDRALDLVRTISLADIAIITRAKRHLRLHVAT